jgi:hypothetical protein
MFVFIEVSFLIINIILVKYVNNVTEQYNKYFMVHSY